MATLFVDKLDPQSGTALEIGTSGDTVTVPAGATFNVAGTLQSGGVSVSNAPSFYAKLSANQAYGSTGAITKVACNTEYWDTDSAYDNSSNYRFTPQSAGKYMVHGCIYVATFATDSIAGQTVYVKKNGGNYQGVTGGGFAYNSNEFNAAGTPFAIVVDMNGSSDYVEVYTQVTFNSGTCEIQYDNNGTPTFWGAYKLIGI